MKTAIFAFITIMVLGFTATAETPYARECRIAGGRQWSVSIQSEFDTTLCLFGRAAVGAAEFAEHKWGHGFALSLKTFLKQSAPTDSNGLCDLVGAAYWTATDSDNGQWELCKFPDGSVVELNTLAGGVSDPQNAPLVRALK